MTDQKNTDQKNLKTNSAQGIDYGLGLCNIDPETGIRYGVISMHSVSSWALDDLEPDFGEPACPSCGGKAMNSSSAPAEVEEQDWFDGQDFYCPECRECFWFQEAYPEEPLGLSFAGDGYQVMDCLQSDLMVTRSPYFTYSRLCSPCVPGAGDLDSPITGVPDPELAQLDRVYCLGHDWFEEGRAPYRVWSVATGEEVNPEGAASTT